jgi:NADPH oxidase
MHPSNTLELRFEKSSLRYKPGQYIFINFPEISQFQWHPFTLTSAPEDGYISVHIRLVGDWTKAVAKRLGAVPSQQYGLTKGDLEDQKPFSNARLPRLCVDGPFGAPAQDYFQKEVAVLVAGGIGVTPFASLLKSMWYKFYRKAPMRLKKVYFIWVNRESEVCLYSYLVVNLLTRN